MLNTRKEYEEMIVKAIKDKDIILCPNERQGSNEETDIFVSRNFMTKITNRNRGLMIYYDNNIFDSYDLDNHCLYLKTTKVRPKKYYRLVFLANVCRSRKYKTTTFLTLLQCLAEQIYEVLNLRHDIYTNIKKEYTNYILKTFKDKNLSCTVANIDEKRDVAKNEYISVQKYVEKELNKTINRIKNKLHKDLDVKIDEVFNNFKEENIKKTA